MNGQNVSETMIPKNFDDPGRRLKRIENDLARMFCVALHYMEVPQILDGDKTATYYALRESEAVNRYRSDSFFHAKVSLLTEQSIRIIEQYI